MDVLEAAILGRGFTRPSTKCGGRDDEGDIVLTEEGNGLMLRPCLLVLGFFSCDS